jgi:hypothetical protein
MASSYNINLPDGSSIPVPAWATEQTLQQLAQMMNRSNLSVDIISDLMQENNMDVSNVAAKMSQLADVDKQEAKQRLQEAKKQGKNFGAKLTGVLDKFNNTEKPLSSLVDMATNLGSQIKESGSSFGKDKSKISKGSTALTGVMDKLGKAMGVAGDIAVVYAGWMAGKAEEFAKAQQNMIDSGAIFYENAGAFNALQTQARDAGIGYEKFTTIVGNFGSAMVGLGGNVSNGAVEFAVLAEKLNDSSDKFGDFGMTSENLAEGFAEFIETQRMAGNIDRTQVGYGDKLVKAYQELLIETGSYASATAFTRKQMLESYTEAMSSPVFAGTMKILDKLGDNATKEAAQAIQVQLKLLEKGGVTDIATPLLGAFEQALSASTGDLQSFDITSYLLENGGEQLIGTLQNVNSTLLTDINTSIRNGEKISGDMIQDLMAAYESVKPGMVIPAGATDGLMGYIKKTQNQMEEFRLKTKAVSEMSEEEREALKDKHTKDLKGAGQLTKVMNDVTEGYLKAMDALTLPMDTFGKVLNTVTTGLSNATGAVMSGVSTEGTIIGRGLEGYHKMGADMRGESILDQQRLLMLGDLPGLRSGGPIVAGSMALVGEEGPEILQMGDMGGMVFPNSVLNNMVDSFKESMYNRDNKAMVSPNGIANSPLSMAFKEAMGGDTSESDEGTQSLEDILMIKKDTVASLNSLNSVLTGMFALSEQRTIASEMS